MAYYVAIVEDAGPDKAVGIWFPDLPGCFSAGDDIDDALRNAHEALALYAAAEAREGRTLPDPRSLSALKADPGVVPDLRDHMVALVALREKSRRSSGMTPVRRLNCFRRNPFTILPGSGFRLLI